MPSRRRAALLALVLAPSLACGPGRASEAPPPAPVRPDARLAPPRPERHRPSILAIGTLAARPVAALAPALGGILRRVAVRRGQQVAEGALLLSLDDDAAQAAVQQAGAGTAAAEAQLRLAEDARQRAIAIQRQEGAVTDQQLLQAEGQRDLAAAQLAGARAQLRLAEVALRHHTLRAPFAGLVTRVPDGVGMPVAPQVPLVSLEGVGTLVLETSVTPEEAAQLRVGAAAEVWIPATGARASGATVSLVLPSVDPATGRVPVEVAVPNPGSRLLAHASARCRLSTGAPRDAFRVAATALLQRDGAHALWTAGPDGRARALPVQLLDQEGEEALVDAGPAGWPAGRLVVERPPPGLVEGGAVAEGAR